MSIWVVCMVIIGLISGLIGVVNGRGFGRVFGLGLVLMAAAVAIWGLIVFGVQ